MDRHYDLVVVGNSPAALATAALVAKRRRRVLLALPPTGPTDAAVTDWAASVAEAPHVRRVLQALNLSYAVRGNHGGQDMRLQLVGQQVRLDVPADPARALATLQAAYPRYRAALEQLHGRVQSQVQQLDRFLAGVPTFPGEGHWARWRQEPLPSSLRPLAAKFDFAAEDALFGEVPRAHELRRMLLWPSLPTGPLPQASAAAPPTILAVLRGLWHTFFAPAAAASNAATWQTYLLQSAERQGAHVLRDVTASKLLLGKKRRAQGIHLGRAHGPQGQDVGCAWLVGDVYAEKWLPPQQPTAGGADEADAVSALPAPWPSWQLQLRPGYLPAPLGPRTWVLDKAELALARPWHAAQLAPQAAPVRLVRHSHADGDTLCATWFCPRGGGTEALLARLQQLLPFVPHQQLKSQDVAATFYVPQAQKPAQSGLPWGRSRTTSLKNVLHCGDDILPELGLEGAFVRAAGIVQLLAQRASWG